VIVFAELLGGGWTFEVVLLGEDRVTALLLVLWTAGNLKYEY